MADVNTTLAALERGRENAGRLYLMVQEQLLNPSQASIDAIVALAGNSNLVAKPSYSLDGESYQWESYAESLLRQIDSLTDLINKLGAPWEIRSTAR